jgi:hypothetical protein|tara:strand:- start:309 stop:548 length:240 start_codon:yes stop_codon:yes gene_type:complete
MRIKLVKDKPPFKGAIMLYDNGAIVKNPYSGETSRLNALELSIYDTIKGCEMTQKYDEVERGLSWFQKFNANAYMILLD